MTPATSTRTTSIYPSNRATDRGGRESAAASAPSSSAASSAAAEEGQPAHGGDSGARSRPASRPARGHRAAPAGAPQQECNRGQMRRGPAEAHRGGSGCRRARGRGLQGGG
eukprot:scaffold2033_cov367-Prasinococcus_capsulatus_cf.AAC.15